MDVARLPRVADVVNLDAWRYRRLLTPLPVCTGVCRCYGVPLGGQP